MSAYIVGYTDGEYGAAYCVDHGTEAMAHRPSEFESVYADDDRADYGPCATCGVDLFAGANLS